ncbi:MAG: SAM-dependent methyltransferase [Gammaproteobacteria bacterium]|jgi:SAM-dependent methyltransferase
MADLLKMDPARIERLRDPARLQLVNPQSVLRVVTPFGDGPIVDVGAGVGFVSLVFARRFSDVQIIACDVLPGMLEVLAQAAAEEDLRNVRTVLMASPTSLGLDDGVASMLIMLQVHHELDDAAGLLRECRRVLAPGAPIVIIDWKDEDLPGMPKGGRRVAQSQIVQDLSASGFADISCHEVYNVHSTVIGIAP